jgi:hypothetical protein
MKKPKCKLCGSPHWTYEPHAMSAGTLERDKEVPPIMAFGSPLSQPAINKRLTDKERLTGAINTPIEDKPAGVHPVQVVRKSVPDAPAPPLLPATPRTPNRRSREAYNSYMKTYMRAYRGRSR